MASSIGLTQRPGTLVSDVRVPPTMVPEFTFHTSPALVLMSLSKRASAELLWKSK